MLAIKAERLTHYFLKFCALYIMKRIILLSKYNLFWIFLSDTQHMWSYFLVSGTEVGCDLDLKLSSLLFRNFLSCSCHDFIARVLGFVFRFLCTDVARACISVDLLKDVFMMRPLIVLPLKANSEMNYGKEIAINFIAKAKVNIDG